MKFDSDPNCDAPLLVDLDGTLIDGDTLHLSLRQLIRARPWVAPALPFAVLSGRARFKEFVSDRVSLDPASLPYRSDVVAFVKQQRARARPVVLATAAHRRIADAVAGHLGLFDAVIATDGANNAKGAGKLASIRAHLGDAEFDYVGDSMADVPIFRAARLSYLVSPTAALEKAVRASCQVEAVFP
ncbi:MAG TPA: haloacid dehalogenase-like hydrolase [Gemmatimonadaceae bacterium]|nr:haloacid dehalogenase-like hydrolase [Gemmatimonadaceae bacterium]